MKAYLNLVQYVLDNGILKKNRTGTDTLMSFGLLFDSSGSLYTSQ